MQLARVHRGTQSKFSQLAHFHAVLLCAAPPCRRRGPTDRGWWEVGVCVRALQVLQQHGARTFSYSMQASCVHEDRKPIMRSYAD